MKFKRIRIEGFRGVRDELDLPLDGKSLCLLGENGHGKSTIVDGLELWATGGLAQFTREGCGLDATVNLDHGGPAVIACDLTGGATAARRLTGRTAGHLEVPDGAGFRAEDCADLPILRHRTMARFMDLSAGEKKRELLGLLGLDELLAFRDTLVTAANQTARRVKESGYQVGAEERTLSEILAGQSMLDRAESLREAAGLEGAIDSEQALLDLELARDRVAGRVDRSDLVEKLRRALASVGASPISTWNALLADKHATESEALEALTLAGQRVLERWETDTCPLCRSSYPRDRLGAELAERAQELEQVARKLREARTELKRFAEALGVVIEAIGAVFGAPPSGGWPRADELEGLSQDLRTHREELGVALEENQQVHRQADLERVERLLPELSQAALDRRESEPLGALANLIRLQDSFARLRKLRRAADADEHVSEAVEELRDATEKRLRATVEAHIDRLGEVAANFYGRLVRNPVFSDVKLTWRDGRSGGVEFQLRYAGAHEVSPPQRVLSESQLNSLALALFLARAKLDDSPWRAMVLDDVVNSYDADHRLGLAGLLSEEFDDWQVLLLTHDSVFVRTAANFMPGWRKQQITAWSPQSGPVLDMEEPLVQLKRRLDDGETGSQLGSHARAALERGLKRPVQALGLPMRFDEQSRHGPPEYLRALRGGLEKLGFEPSGLPDLRRIERESYLVNLGAHDRGGDPALTANDLRELVTDLEELDAAFKCSDCEKPVWSYTTGHFQGFHCGCGKLAI